MPTPNPASLRVAECRGCRQLFAVYATEGAVACPSCGTPVEIATLETAPLGVAEPIEVRIDAPEPVAPAEPPVEPAAAPLTEPVAEEPVAQEAAPTVAEWLMRDEGPATTDIAGDETLPAPEPSSAAKPTLSESLGWKESLPGYDPPHEEPVAPAPSLSDPAPVASAPEPTREAAESRDEFRFDFGATPLSENPTTNEESDGVSLDLTTPEEVEADESAPQAAELSWDRVLETNDERRRGWFAPLATLAAVALVAAGAGFYLLGDNEPEALAEANRDNRLLIPGGEEDPTPPNPYAAADPREAPGFESAGEPRIVDTATVPATFNAPSLNQPEESDLSPLADPVAVLPGRNPPAGEAVPSRPPLAELPPAPSRASAVAKEVGLMGVPTSSLQELAASLTEAEAAGRAFVAGDLANPEQAPEIGQRYAQLSYLAQAITLLDPADHSSRRMSVEMQAVDIFEKVLLGARARAQTLQVAGPWIDWSGRPHGGVFFSGDPTGVSRVGEVMRYDFQVGEQTIPVLTAEPLDTRRLLLTGATEIGVLGIVVEDPQKWIAGYEGAAERVIWARKTLPLREPVEL